MRKGRVILFLLLCAIAAGTAALLWRGEKEPTHNGMTLMEWIILHERCHHANVPLGSRWAATNIQLPLALLSLDDPGFHPSSSFGKSEEAVHQIGTNALPWLLKWIQCERSSWRYRSSLAADKLFGEGSHPVDYDLGQDPGWIKGEVAVAGFAILRTNASGAVPELMRIMESRNSPALTQRILYTLYFVEPDGMPQLLAILKSPKDPRRADVVWAFRFCDRMGTNRTLAIKLLSECVRDKDAALAARAIDSLGWAGCEPDIAVPALIDGLQDPRDKIRGGCAWSLASFGESAKAAVPALTAALQHTNANVRAGAAHALEKIVPDVVQCILMEPPDSR